MKKILLFILMFSMLAVTSCSSAPGKKYDVRLTDNIEGDVFKNSVTVFKTEEASTERFDEPTECEVAFGNKKINVDLISERNYTHKAAQRVYLSKDKNTEYRKSTKCDSFTVQARNGTALATYTGDTLSEQNLKDAASEFMSAYIDTGTLDKYAYSCTSDVVVSKPDAAWKETKEGFVLPNGSTETVTGYKLEYRKLSREFDTEDGIVVMCSANGDITGFCYYENNIDWASAAFEKDLIKSTVDSYIKDNLSKEYKLLDMSIKSEQLVYLDEKIQLAVAVELDLSKDSGKLVVLCPLLLSD